GRTCTGEGGGDTGGSAAGSCRYRRGRRAPEPRAELSADRTATRHLGKPRVSAVESLRRGPRGRLQTPRRRFVTAGGTVPHPDQGPRAGRSRAPAVPTGPAVLRPGRLDGLARRIAGVRRRAFGAGGGAADLSRRARAPPGITGRPARVKRLPDVLTLEEFQRMLTEAYRADPRDGLLLRLLFESAVRVSELSRLDAADVEFGERTLRIRQ